MNLKNYQIVEIETKENHSIYSEALKQTKGLRERMADSGKSCYITIIIKDSKVYAVFPETSLELIGLQKKLTNNGYIKNKERIWIK